MVQAIESDLECVSNARRSGDRLIVDRARREVQTFLDELKNGTRKYRTIASLGGQITQSYRGRCVLELLQNGHDALTNTPPDDPRQISFLLRTHPEPVLMIANSGHPFHQENFEGLCELGQSPKDPNKSVGNKGLGFRSVLEVSSCPEIWSTAPPDGDTAFAFRFDPSVSDRVESTLREIRTNGLNARSPFDPDHTLLDWSEQQLEQFRLRTSNTAFDTGEAKRFLSPYSIPLPINDNPSEVENLLDTGYVTIIRLPLDGGGTGTGDEAAQSVRNQLSNLDERSMVFLPDLEKLVIDVDGECRTLERVIDPGVEFSNHQKSHLHHLLVGQSGPAPDGQTTRQFQIWTRTIGGEDDPEQADRIREMVKHLPNRWPEVNQVTVSVAVEEAMLPDKGCFVIFLPTDMKTGTGAHVNAPFYGSLDRRQIAFSDPYNRFLLKVVLDLILDAAVHLVSDEPGGWRARAIIDLLSSTTTVSEQNFSFMDRLDERATELGKPLRNLPLILCGDRWCDPCEARTMPQISDDIAVNPGHWRNHAAFAVVSTVLDDRQPAVEALISKLGGSVTPTDAEWRQTLEQVATSVRDGQIDVTWDGFLHSLITVLPKDICFEPETDTSDPLADARFLPDQNDRLISASDPTRLFFQPVRDVDDAADFVEDVPDSLSEHIAFLHRSIQTQQGPQGRNTPVQKFLEGRFARGFRKEELLRVVLNVLPRLPVPYEDDSAALCSELFAWTLKLLGEDPSDGLMGLVKKLPVACHGGWHTIDNAVFGPGWPDRLGDEIWALADDLPADPAARLREKALLPPDDSRWGIDVSGREGLFTWAGVFDGLRLKEALPTPSFDMAEFNYVLPSDAPDGIPQQAWDHWHNAVHEQIEPPYIGWHKYELTEIQLLPEIHHLGALEPTGRAALSRLLLASLEAWPAGWESTQIKKLDGHRWSYQITSPLKHWLTTLDWLGDGDIFKPLNDRWLVPLSIIGNQSGRFGHLNPLTAELVRRLEDQPDLAATLRNLGLNAYPVGEDRTGPELLHALAAAWDENRIPAGRFDVFLGQVRDAWRHFGPDQNLPEKFLVRTGRRSFAIRRRRELADVYLPDSRERIQSLLQHGKHFLEMHPRDAARNAQALSDKTGIRQASTLEERFFIDDAHWGGNIDGSQPLDETALAWLSVPLLAIAAHGGANPTGSTTDNWLKAVEKLRRAQIIRCESIAVQLVDGDDMVAGSDSKAQWLPGDVLAIRRDIGLSYEHLAPAAQNLLDRQDLLKDLRLVLREISGQENPLLENIGKALELAEIDAHALADIHNHWVGSISLIVDRVRPVLTLLDIPADGLDQAVTSIESLTKWLPSRSLLSWPIPELLSAARQSRDDHAMGMAAWRTLGERAQLPEWNAALARLGDRYATVENSAEDVNRQVDEHREETKSLLRGLARHIAIETGKPGLFHQLEAINRDFRACPDWSTRWWEVPFSAVMEALHEEYAAISGTERHLRLFTATTLEELQQEFHDQGIEAGSDPYETARSNEDGLSETLASLHDLYRVWLERNGNTRTPPTLPALPELDPCAYLHPWHQAEMIRRSIDIIADLEFADACKSRNSLDEVRDHLGLDRQAVKAQQCWRQERQRDEERKRRTIDVAGFDFEVGAASYGDLFRHLEELPDLTGPQASKDKFTDLTEPSSVGGSSRNGNGGKLSHLWSSPREQRELVGIVGEMQAYRFLCREFGRSITRDAWVSEIRLQALPLVPGEPDNTSDSHGYDFRFRYEKELWHIEVKATVGDDTQFKLGISEIRAATCPARLGGGRWRILRVRNALSDSPEFDWLPNPFEEKSRQFFRLHKEGMRVSYRRRIE